MFLGHGKKLESIFTTIDLDNLEQGVDVIDLEPSVIDLG